MALSPYERVKRWRQKNRVVYNLRQRDARKRKSEEKITATKPEWEKPVTETHWEPDEYSQAELEQKGIAWREARGY